MVDHRFSVLHSLEWLPGEPSAPACGADWFARDCLWVAEHAMAEPDRIPDVAAFVLLSIRQPFLSIGARVAEYRQRGADSQYLGGWKRDTLRHVKRHHRAIHRDLEAFMAGRINQSETLWRLTRIPGLGPAKGAFLGQLLTGRFACLDSMNLLRLGIGERQFRMDKAGASERRQRRIISAYLATCNMLGDSAHWWNAWCQHLADRERNRRGYRIPWRMTGDQISALHRLAIPQR
jgi:hypothetical protein